MKNFLIVLLSATVAFLIVSRMQRPEAPPPVPAHASATVSPTPTPAAPSPVVSSPAVPRAAAPPAEAAVLARALLDASVKGDFDAFKRVAMTKGDERMRMVMSAPDTEATFRRASSVVGPVCKDGYALDPLGTLVQTGHKVFLWRLRPGAGNDEFLVRLTLKDDRVAGFFFQ